MQDLQTYLDQLPLKTAEKLAGAPPEEKPKRKWGPCIVCHRRLYRDRQDFTKRGIPDYYCSQCFNAWKDQLKEPWMKRLQHTERYRRMKIQRFAARLAKIRESATL